MFYGVYLPIAGYSLECLAPPIREPQPGARHQILHRSGNKYFTSTGQRRDPCPDVNDYAANIVAHDFALASVQPCTNVDPEWTYFLRNRTGATNTARWAIESRKNAVPCCLDLMAAKASEIATDRGVMFVEEIMPAAIAKRGSFLGRANDVSKQNGGENPVHRDWRPRTGQKLLDGISDLHGIVADEWYVIFSRKFDIARAGNVLGQITSTLHVDGHVFGSMDD